MKISLRRRQALTVADGAFSHEIDYVTIFNRPGVAGAVLHTASSMIHSLIN